MFPIRKVTVLLGRIKRRIPATECRGCPLEYNWIASGLFFGRLAVVPDNLWQCADQVRNLDRISVAAGRSNPNEEVDEFDVGFAAAVAVPAAVADARPILRRVSQSGAGACNRFRTSQPVRCPAWGGAGPAQVAVTLYRTCSTRMKGTSPRGFRAV
jgi:hypothetical protein